MHRLALPLALALAAPLALPATAAADRALSTTTTRNVSATEYAFALRKRAPRGVVVFRVKNNGAVTHNFKIAGKVTKPIVPGQTRSLRVTLKKGTHGFRCTLPGHAAAGMKGTFRAI